MIALLPVALALLGVPATAGAKSYCVNPATGCDVNGIAATAIQTALNDAQGDSTGSDVVQLGVTSYNQTGLTYGGTIPLTLQGAGTAQTAIAPAAGGTIFRNNSTQPVSIQGITFTLPSATDSTGIQGFSGPIAVSQVVVNFVGAPPSPAHGIALVKGGSVTNSTVTMPTPTSTSSVSDGIDATGSGDVTLADDTVTGRFAVQVSGRTSGNVSAHRLRLATANANGAGFIVVEPAAVTLDDSIATVGTNASGLFVSGGVAGGSATLTARHVTVVGDGAANEDGFTVYGASGGGTGTLNVFDSIVRNTTRSVYVTQGTGGPAVVGGDYNDFPGATNAADSHIFVNGVQASFTPGPHNIDANPLFAGANDFHLLVGSPAANRDPTAQQAGESSTDLDGNPRFATRTGRDMGAYQQQPPTASASASPASQVTGAPFTFNGSGSDPTTGSTLTYSWAFDDGASASGATVMHAFATPGSHSGTLTVTDTAGRTGTATATVTVTPTAVIPLLPPLPDLEGFTLTNRTFAVGGPATPIGGALTATVKRGTRFKFRINTAAAVTLTFQRALPGRRAGRSCLPPRRRKRGRHDKPCTRYVGMGHINRSVPGAGSYSIAFSGHVSGSSALAVGKYHAILGAKNASGAATPRTTSFTIVAVPKKHKKRGH
jgi:hypothetical protein